MLMPAGKLKDDKIQKAIIMPKELADWINEQADMQGRSFSGQVAFMLKKAQETKHSLLNSQIDLEAFR
jgi:hypothetical protein